MNYAAHTVEFFEWSPTSTGWIGLAGRERFELDAHNRKQYLKVHPKVESKHLPISVQEVKIPLNGLIPQMEVEIIDWYDGLYGLIEKDADKWPHPQTPT
jgi:hypothetical protein